MTPATFRLECFDADARLGAISAPAQPALDQAYRDGHAEGMRQQREIDVLGLVASLDGLRESLGRIDGLRAEIERETIESFRPVLTEILDCLDQVQTSPRLEIAFRDQLSRLTKAALPPGLRISCPDALRSMVDRVLADWPGIGVKVTTESCDGIQIAFEGGHASFTTGRIAAQIRGILTENLTSQERTWTSSNR